MAAVYNVTHTVEYMVPSAGDRLFIPVNGPMVNDATPSDGANLNQSMADQLAQCQKMSPVGSAVVVT